MADDSKKDKNFFTPFEDMNAHDLPPIVTELVRPFENGFDLSKIGNFGSILGSVMETGQTFRNVFNNSLSPSSIANMASSGLQTELNKLLSNFGFSKFLGEAAPTFSKTSYGYVDAEKQLNKSPNIQLDFNPIGMFSSIVQKLFDQTVVQEDQQKLVDNFYLTVNNVRKKIWNLNAELYINIEKIRIIHSTINKTETILTPIFHSESIFNDRYSIRDQIKAFAFAVESYLVTVADFSKFVSNKEDYAACISLLKAEASQMSSFLKYKELGYVYEDLKLLRKTPDSEFNPIP